MNEMAFSDRFTLRVADNPAICCPSVKRVFDMVLYGCLGLIGNGKKWPVVSVFGKSAEVRSFGARRVPFGSAPVSCASHVLARRVCVRYGDAWNGKSA